jgi:hypothetical protein
VLETASDKSVSKLLRSPVSRSDGDMARIAWRMSHTRDVGRRTLLSHPFRTCVQARPSVARSCYPHSPPLRCCAIRTRSTVPLCVVLARLCLLLADADAAAAPRLGPVALLRRHAPCEVGLCWEVEEVDEPILPKPCPTPTQKQTRCVGGRKERDP